MFQNILYYYIIYIYICYFLPSGKKHRIPGNEIFNFVTPKKKLICLQTILLTLLQGFKLGIQSSVGSLQTTDVLKQKQNCSKRRDKKDIQNSHEFIYLDIVVGLLCGSRFMAFLHLPSTT